MEEALPGQRLDDVLSHIIATTEIQPAAKDLDRGERNATQWNPRPPPPEEPPLDPPPPKPPPPPPQLPWLPPPPLNEPKALAAWLSMSKKLSLPLWSDLPALSLVS